MRILYAIPITGILAGALFLGWEVVLGAVLGFTVAVWTDVLRDLRSSGYEVFGVWRKTP